MLNSDAGEFGGHKRIDHNTEFVTFAEGWDNRMNHMFVSIAVFCVNRHHFRSSHFHLLSATMTGGSVLHICLSINIATLISN